jgi:hypothetical protein
MSKPFSSNTDRHEPFHTRRFAVRRPVSVRKTSAEYEYQM